MEEPETTDEQANPQTALSPANTPAESKTSQAIVTTETTESTEVGFWNTTTNDLLTFGAGIISSWPLALLLALLLLKQQIHSLLERLLKWDGFGFNMEFREGVQKLESSMTEAKGGSSETTATEVTPDESEIESVEARALPSSVARSTEPDAIERIQRLLELSPRAVVVESFSKLEDRARTVGIALSISPPKLQNVVRELIEQKKLPESARGHVAELTDLRNRAVHLGGESIAAEDALRYWKLAEQMGKELIRVLQEMQNKYRLVFKGGPNNGVIETGDAAKGILWAMAAKPIPDTQNYVVGEPQIGRVIMTTPTYLVDAMFRQGLDISECHKLWSRAGLNSGELLKPAYYAIESTNDDLIVMAYKGNTKPSNVRKEQKEPDSQ